MAKCITSAMMAQRPDGTMCRHGGVVRAWHWLNALAMAVMLMSGLAIFNAHPRLYWGVTGTWGDRAWLQIGSSGDRGLLFIGDRMFDTTGTLGLSWDGDGNEQRRAMPSWATLPTRYDLALARNWHFMFAWLVALGWVTYILHGLLRGHIRRDLLVPIDHLHPRALWRDIRAHTRLDTLRALSTERYNSLQQLSYLVVIFLLIPMMILSGLSMSPAMNAALSWLPDMFGGRQSARSFHFIIMICLIMFVAIHLLMVLLAGPIRLIRSMVTGSAVGRG